MTDKKYLKVSEVSIIFKRHPATIRRWVREGKLEALKIRNGYLIPASEVENLKVKGGENR